MTHRHRAQLAFNRIIAVVGEEKAVKIWIDGITAQYPRLDLIADQGDQLADDVESSADYDDLLEQRYAR